VRAWIFCCASVFCTCIGARATGLPAALFDDAAQDRSGRVWAISAGDENGLYVSSGGAWQQVVAESRGWRPARLGATHDGGICCLWQNGEGKYRLTIHAGQNATAIATWNVPKLDQPHLENFAAA